MFTATDLAHLAPATVVTIDLPDATHLTGSGPYTTHLRFTGVEWCTVIGDRRYRLPGDTDPTTVPTPVERWFTFAPLHDGAYLPAPSPRIDIDAGYEFDSMARTLALREGGTGWTVQPLTADGETFADKHAPLERRRARLMDRLRTIDPDLATEVRDLLDAAEDDAYDRGYTAGTSE